MGAKSGRQVAALPMRLTEAGVIELLLVTSRETRRWIIPKGWSMKGLKDHRAAAKEAEEEAGLKGRVLKNAVGRYTYWRRTKRDFRLTSVSVFLMGVEGQLGAWKEKGQRDLCWIDAKDAAGMVQEPDLITLIESVIARPDTRAFLSRLTA
ncbi:NUDIX hydrolase [Aureimonas sp. SA4125]|uniref:NUDIX hydrolase n=1 Tax=Aureimonas sp. SA4125 TaxID=2826993 RepID=UPI001CC67FDD|nr:NUDIX hydrolase [Aureimonas sp. SA4125]BDA86995.1 NUDIX hydrolase [Aureimonas sp. SA4125]